MTAVNQPYRIRINCRLKLTDNGVKTDASFPNMTLAQVREWLDNLEREFPGAS